MHSRAHFATYLAPLLLPAAPLRLTRVLRAAPVRCSTFVCGDCKAGHQAISHRIKGVSMSTFTEDEVDRLRERGNRYAQATWLGRLTRAEVCDMCPRKDDRCASFCHRHCHHGRHAAMQPPLLADLLGVRYCKRSPEVWHKWIERIYERREFYLEPGAASEQRNDRGRAEANRAEANRDEWRRDDGGRRDERRVERRAEAPRAAAARPARDDDDGFGALAGGSTDPFASDPFASDPFASDPFAATAPPSGTADPFAELAGTSDPFGDFASGARPAAVQSADAFDLFGSAPAAVPAAVPAAAAPADDFFGSMAPAPVPVTTGAATTAPADDVFGTSAPSPPPATTARVTTGAKESIMGLFSQPNAQPPMMSQPMGMMQPQPTMMMQGSMNPQQMGMMQQGMSQHGMMQPQQMGMMQQGVYPQGMMMRPGVGVQMQQGIVQQVSAAPAGQIGNFFN